MGQFRVEEVVAHYYHDGAFVEAPSMEEAVALYRKWKAGDHPGGAGILRPLPDGEVGYGYPLAECDGTGVVAAEEVEEGTAGWTGDSGEPVDADAARR